MLSGRERHETLRAQTAPTASLSDSEKTSARHRSKSAVTSPRILNNKLGEYFSQNEVFPQNSKILDHAETVFVLKRVN